MHKAIKNRVWCGVALAATLLGSQTASAIGWVVGATIVSIQVTPTGNVVLYVAGDNGCGGTRLEYDTNATAAKMVYAGLLAAQAQNRPMDFNVTSCIGVDVAVFQHIQG